MRIDQLTIELRPRSHWQAADLGLLLLRNCWKPVFGSWWAIWLPLALLLFFGFSAENIGWAALLLWWLKPLCERAQIYVMSRAVFGDAPTIWQTLKALPTQLRGSLLTFTWWRPLILGRALYVPVWQLEGLSGQEAQARREVLGGQGTYASAAWHAIICAHFEGVVQLSILLLLGILASSPENINPFILFAKGQNHPILIAQWSYWLYVLAAGVIGPCNVAGGFAMYLNRRSLLEGWDIELAFRRMRERLSSQKHTISDLGVIATLLLLGCCCLSVPKTEAAPALPSRESAHVRQLTEKIVGDAVFSGKQTVHSWRLKSQPEGWFSKWLERLLTPKADKPTAKPAQPSLAAISLTLKWLAISAVLTGLIYLAYRYRSLLPQGTEERSTYVPPVALFGLDLRPESLPADIGQAAAALWARGEQRLALALLYRGALAHLVRARALELPAAATEGECLRLARQGLDAAATAYFSRLTDAWLQAAYANHFPDSSWAMGLCQDWPMFAGARA